ncbi:ester cyclase [Bradyrhizobium elkanii]
MHADRAPDLKSGGTTHASKCSLRASTERRPRYRQRANGDEEMSEENKNVVGRWFKEFWGNPWNPRIINELATADIVVHYPMHEPKRGRAAVMKFMTEFREAFPDLNFWGVGDLIAEGDLVVGRWEGGGTHTGPAFSDFRLGSLPAASGRKMTFAGTTVLRVQDGRIAEELGQEDAITAMLQLGLIRLPEHDGAASRPGRRTARRLEQHAGISGGATLNTAGVHGSIDNRIITTRTRLMRVRVMQSIGAVNLKVSKPQACWRHKNIAAPASHLPMQCRRGLAAAICVKTGRSGTSSCRGRAAGPARR